jgi:thiamine-phosphate pyrophosphorylase
MTETTLAVPRLIVFTDATRAAASTMLARFDELGRRAVAGSVLFSLRDYQLSARSRWQLALELAALAARREQSLGVADRADLARAVGSSACHLPERGLRVADARRYLGGRVFLSQACHDPAAVGGAELDAQLLSPIFAAKKGRSALGIPTLAQAARAAQANPGGPALFALGGVEAGNARACLTAGAAGVAVIGAALAPDPTPLLEALGILRV